MDMTSKYVTIGSAARETGLSVKAIRFYEDQGYLRPAWRTAAGYRMFDRGELSRLRLIRRARQLGVSLPDIGALLKRASGDCTEMVDALSLLITQQRDAITGRIAELEALRSDLDSVELHLRHCQCAPGVLVEDCDYCLIPERKEVITMDETSTAQVEDVIELVAVTQNANCDCDCCPDCPPDCC